MTEPTNRPESAATPRRRGRAEPDPAGPAERPEAGPGGPGARFSFGPDFLNDLFRFPLDPGYADAARRRREHGPRPGARRAILRVASALTALTIGLLMVTAYRQALAAEPGRSAARAGLVSQINERQDATDALARRAETLRDEVARQRDAALADNEAARLRDLEASTGLAKVRGDGVVVTVDDAPSAVDAVTGAGTEQDLGRVFDQDLQNIANALWAAGAEAIAINGQRLTATTTIRSAGRAILVDFRPVTRPYKIYAIGPGGMDRDFSASPTAKLFRGLVDTYGMSYGLRDADDLTLPGAAGPRLRFAKPVTGWPTATAPTSLAPTSLAPTSLAPTDSGSPGGSPRVPAGGGGPGGVPTTTPPGGGP